MGDIVNMQDAACTRESHELLKLDPVVWASMEYRGIQVTGLEYDLELRNCKCGSTLCIRIEALNPGSDD